MLSQIKRHLVGARLFARHTRQNTTLVTEKMNSTTIKYMLDNWIHNASVKSIDLTTEDYSRIKNYGLGLYVCAPGINMNLASDIWFSSEGKLMVYSDIKNGNFYYRKNDDDKQFTINSPYDCGNLCELGLFNTICFEENFDEEKLSAIDREILATNLSDSKSNLLKTFVINSSTDVNNLIKFLKKYDLNDIYVNGHRSAEVKYDAIRKLSNNNITSHWHKYDRYIRYKSLIQIPITEHSNIGLVMTIESFIGIDNFYISYNKNSNCVRKNNDMSYDYNSCMIDFVHKNDDYTVANFIHDFDHLITTIQKQYYLVSYRGRVVAIL
jgi:hypothetical protein